jgi:hypothetical protein
LHPKILESIIVIEIGESGLLDALICMTWFNQEDILVVVILIEGTKTLVLYLKSITLDGPYFRRFHL